MDGLLLTRRERLVLFWEKLGLAFGPSFLLAAILAALGYGTVAVAILVLAGLTSLAVTTSARTLRGAAYAGVAVMLLLLLLQAILNWFLTHPILSG